MSNRRTQSTSQSITNLDSATEATRGNGTVAQNTVNLVGGLDRDTHDARSLALVVCRCALVLSNGQTVRPLCPFAPWVCEGYAKRGR
jgi:hypothetical protein